MKNIYYFSHDINARNDLRLQELVMNMGYEGLGYYWCLVEMLYEQEGKIELSKCDGIAFGMRTDCDKIKQLIDIVFEKDSTHFWSNSVLSRIKMQKDKSKKAKESAQKRWDIEPKKRNAVAIEGNAIKESKVKEIKVNKSKVKEKEDTTLYSLEDSHFIKIAEKYDVTLAFVRSKYDDLVNWHEKNPRKNHYENYYRGLMDWVKKDAMERRENAKSGSKISYAGDTL